MKLCNTRILNMEVTRGDSMSLVFEAEGFPGTLEEAAFTVRDLPDGDAPGALRFRKTLRDGIEKASGAGEAKYIVALSAEDTSLPEGKYLYDLQIGAGGGTYTVIKGIFETTFEVTTEG